VLGIVQSAFGNVAELALTVVALRDGLPDVVRIAIAGSLFGNAILLGGAAGFAPFVRARGRSFPSLRFDQRLFTGIATLCVISVLPIALLSLSGSSSISTGGRQDVSLFSGIALLATGIFFLFSELRRPSGRVHVDDSPPVLSARGAYTFLAVGGTMAAATSDWFVAGFVPAVERLGIPTAFAALVIVPLLGNVAENYVALRYAWAGDGDAAMSVIMHSVVQIALLMTGILLIVSQFVGPAPLTLRYDPVVALALVLSMVALWMIVQDGEIEPVEAVGLLGVYTILCATVWAEGAF
jgi:Ca2+:H+ antiporter